MSNKTLRTSILLASLLAVGGFASAQSTPPKGDGTDNKVKAEAATTMKASSDKTRADVKAEAKADNKAMPKNKSGEGADVAGKPNPAGEMKTRADVKADAKAPLATGEGADKGKNIVDEGKTGRKPMKKGEKTSMGTTDMPVARADVKAEAKAANKAAN